MIDMRKYLTALKEKSIDHFTIKAIGWELSTIRGILKKSIGGICFKVLNGLEQTSCLDLDDQLFDISFHSNSTTFQLQHNALKWIQTHNLFEKIIQNDIYSLNVRASEESSRNVLQFR